MAFVLESLESEQLMSLKKKKKKRFKFPNLIAVLYQAMSVEIIELKV